MKYILSLFAFFSFTGFVFCQTEVKEASIKEALAQISEKYNLSVSDIEEYRISDQYTRKQNGSTHVYLLQTIHGLDVFNAQVQLHFSKKGKLVFSNSSFVKEKNAKWNASAAAIDLKTAFLPVLDSLSLSAVSMDRIRFDADSPGNWKLVDNNLFFHPVRIRLGYEEIADKLILVYQFALEPRSDKKGYTVKVDATTGKIVRIIHRTLNCQFEHAAEQSDPCMQFVPSPDFPEDVPVTPKSGASYNVFPLGIESPIHGSRSILTNIENTVASPFGWHDIDGIPGADYFITRGNNVFVYEDTTGLNEIGYSPSGGPALNFDFPLDLSLRPVQNMDAALTNLFVWNNFMHDITYHYGFDEESGNFQLNNYGKGGEEDDAVFAEGLDGEGFNNANFTVLEDGYNPTMQMYIWKSGTMKLLKINAPIPIAGTYITGIPSFGLEDVFPSVTAEVVLINSGGSNPSQGCAEVLNDLTGKIALVDIENCSFVEKTLHAQQAGAVGVIIVNNVSGMLPPPMWGIDDGLITIPLVSVAMEDGNMIRSVLQTGTINVTLGGDIVILDSDFDNGIIAHEYGHGVSSRLTGGPSEMDCLLNEEQAGEGWSDFFALIMTTKPASTADQARGIGNFASNAAFDGNGIRPYPYSRDMEVNPVTYGDVSSFMPPHGTGSVWCSVLWDLYWNMVDKYGNSNDLYATNGGNNKAIQLVMEGLRMQVCRPGFVDSRDAILAADALLFDGENSCLIWRTFARRGLGYSADQGSSDMVGDEAEAFDLPPACFETGMDEVKLSDFKIYPVPTSDVLKVDNTKGMTIHELVVFDLSGKEILRKKQTEPEGLIDVSGLTGGVYLLQIHSGETSFQKRFVIL